MPSLFPLPSSLALVTLSSFHPFTLSSASAQTPDKPKASATILDSRRVGQVTIDRFRDLLLTPETGYFKSPGPIRIIVEDADTHEKTVLLADDAEGEPNGDIRIRGHLRVERPEGFLIGQGALYNGAAQTGELLSAEAHVQGSILRGDKVELLQDSKGRQLLKATGAYFTTCIDPRPHYHITAREIRVSSNRKVTAKNVGFYLGNTRLLTLPSLSRDFNSASESPLPLPGYTKDNFIQLRFRNEVVAEPMKSFNYDITLSLKRTPSGTANYERDLGKATEDTAPPATRKFAATEPLRTALEANPALLRGTTPEIDRKRVTFFATAAANTFVYNRRRTDLRVSRLPEFGFSFRNILNRPTPEDDPKAPYPRAESAFGSAFLSPAKWFINMDASFGYYQEMPTHGQGTRASLRGDVTTPLFSLADRLYIRYGGTAWLNAYGNGNAYALVAPEAEIDFLLKRNTLIGAGYRYMQDTGKTPFQFDQRDVKHELRLRYGFLGAHWAYDTEIKYDMERLRAYDSVFSIRKRLDCLEFGVAYHTRNQGISLLFNLLPGALTTKGGLPGQGAGMDEQRPQIFW